MDFPELVATNASIISDLRSAARLPSFPSISRSTTSLQGGFPSRDPNAALTSLSRIFQFLSHFLRPNRAFNPRGAARFSHACEVRCTHPGICRPSLRRKAGGGRKRTPLGAEPTLEDFEVAYRIRCICARRWLRKRERINVFSLFLPFWTTPHEGFEPLIHGSWVQQIV
jgi:hypothetical protein